MWVGKGMGNPRYEFPYPYPYPQTLHPYGFLFIIYFYFSFLACWSSGPASDITCIFILLPFLSVSCGCFRLRKCFSQAWSGTAFLRLVKVVWWSLGGFSSDSVGSWVPGGAQTMDLQPGCGI